MTKSRRSALLVFLFVAATALMTACSNEKGLHVTNQSDQPVTMLIAVTGENPTDPGTPAEPGETVVLPIPTNEDITLSALYSSGFKANSLFTAQELADGCKGKNQTQHCRFNFTGQQFKLNAFNPAEDLASNATIGIIIFAAIILTITLTLFFRNRKSDID